MLVGTTKCFKFALFIPNFYTTIFDGIEKVDKNISVYPERAKNQNFHFELLKKFSSYLEGSHREVARRCMLYYKLLQNIYFTLKSLVQRQFL